MSRLSLFAVRVTVTVCGAVIFMIRQRSSGVPCTFRVAFFGVGGGLHSDVSRETSEELARVIGNMGIAGSGGSQVLM